VSRFLPDVNIWLAMCISGHADHARARCWFDARADEDLLAFCRVTQHGVLRLLTNAAVMAPFGDPPLTNEAAWSVFDALCADDRIDLVEREPSGIDERWRSFSTRATASTRLWTDAYLAAFAVAGDYTVVTVDNAFRQFDGVALELL
jgi:toxin-antitoxin system PIN domain toxin